MANHLNEVQQRNRKGKADDEFYTPSDFVENLMSQLNDQLDLSNYKIWLPFDSNKSEFTKWCNKHNLDYVNTSDDYKNHLTDEFKKCDLIVSNPPFSLLGQIFDDLCQSKTKYVLLEPRAALTRQNVFQAIRDNHCFPWILESTTGFIRPDGSTKRVNTIIITNIPNLKIKKKKKSWRQLTDGIKCDPPYERYTNFNNTSSFIVSNETSALVPITALVSEYKDGLEPQRLIRPSVLNKKAFVRVLVTKKNVNKPNETRKTA